MAEYTEEIGYRGEFLESGHVQVCKVTRILKDGSPISSSNHRYVIAPGDDFSKEADIVQAVCNAVHTSEMVEKYQTAIATEEDKASVDAIVSKVSEAKIAAQELNPLPGDLKVSGSGDLKAP